MKNVLAMVLAGGRVDALGVLTLSRPKSAVPFGGMYRVIDFALSNLMHSGVEKVGILSQYRSFSIINHIGVGSWWDFVGRDRGATLLLPSTGHSVSDWYRGTADAVHQNLEFVREQNPETVLILSGDHVYNMDFRPMLNYHREKDADLTIAFFPIASEASSRFGVAELDDEDGNIGGRVTDYREKPKDVQMRWASLTIFIFKPTILYQLLQNEKPTDGNREFGRDILPGMIDKYKVYGYKFDGYWGYSRTVDEFWQTNMDLLGEKPGIALDDWQVRTNLDHDRLRDRAPARITGSAEISNTRFHNGCTVAGSVQNSILFPGVTVEKGATVKDSILFFDTVVRSGATVDKTITDFDVEIAGDCQVGHSSDASPNREMPEFLKSGITVIGKGVKLPAGLQIGKNCMVYPELQTAQFKEKTYETGTTIR